jgi:hypothetical protein
MTIQTDIAIVGGGPTIYDQMSLEYIVNPE